MNGYEKLSLIVHLHVTVSTIMLNAYQITTANFFFAH